MTLRKTRSVINGDEQWSVYCGDNLALLRELPDNCIDSVVTDPPAGIAFMGRDWDKNRGSRDAFVNWLESVMKECLRVLKPGGHALVWSLPRTSHWTAYALENAGFEIRDKIAHVFGSGYAKNHDVSKAIDKHLGLERPVTGTIAPINAVKSGGGSKALGVPAGYVGSAFSGLRRDQPVSPEAEKWTGYGTALKPSREDWWLCRKPCDGSVAANILKHSTGAINIGACTIGLRCADESGWSKTGSISSENRAMSGKNYDRPPKSEEGRGRWPTNLMMTHSAGCRIVGYRTEKYTINRHIDNLHPFGDASGVPYESSEIKTAYAVWKCQPDCPYHLFPIASGSDEKSTAIYFKQFDYKPVVYVPKAHGAERDTGVTLAADSTCRQTVNREPTSAGANNPRAGANRTAGMPIYECTHCGLTAVGCLDKFAKTECTDADDHNIVHIGEKGGVANDHPTIKTLKLMRYLVRMITPPGGVVLDPFCGSGSTGCAAMLEKARFIGTEIDPKYAAIAADRVRFWANVDPAAVTKDDTYSVQVPKSSAADTRQISIFDML